LIEQILFFKNQLTMIMISIPRWS